MRLPRTISVSTTIALVIALAPLLLASPATALAEDPQVVVSAAYGGGGNAGATLTHDYVELFNRSNGPVDLAGLSIQYASATGTGALGASATQLTELPATTLQPGQYFLVQEAPGTGGTEGLDADFIDPTAISMSATSGKVALVTGTEGLGVQRRLDALWRRAGGAHRRPGRLRRGRLLRGQRSGPRTLEYHRRHPCRCRLHRHERQRRRLHGRGAGAPQRGHGVGAL